ncbi:MAG: UTP--glucose-1-phosphate uridylyltransferase, partial [Planctomycetes bacterium]|nr:UTP--glucose-1-phosphate uridylyltransferase [Planctomycetota bacterium]
QKAILTAASPNQRDLPLQTLVDRRGARRSVFAAQLDEVHAAGVPELAVVIHPGDRDAFVRAAGPVDLDVHWIEQTSPAGYADALLRARGFAGGEPFLHLVGDHVWLSREARGCARQVVDAAGAEACSVAAVMPTRESRLPMFGAIGGEPVRNKPGLYAIEEVLEKPTPTEAEQRLHVSGLRAGQYLCLFGIHVLTPAFWPLLARSCAQGQRSLSPALAALARAERCLAMAPAGVRFDVGAPHGLLLAQLAMALAGERRAEILEELVELLALRDPAGR